MTRPLIVVAAFKIGLGIVDVAAAAATGIVRKPY